MLQSGEIVRLDLPHNRVELTVVLVERPIDMVKIDILRAQCGLSRTNPETRPTRGLEVVSNVVMTMPVAVQIIEPSHLEEEKAPILPGGDLPLEEGLRHLEFHHRVTEVRRDCQKKRRLSDWQLDSALSVEDLTTLAEIALQRGWSDLPVASLRVQRHLILNPPLMKAIPMGGDPGRSSVRSNLSSVRN